MTFWIYNTCKPQPSTWIFVSFPLRHRHQFWFFMKVCSCGFNKLSFSSSSSSSRLRSNSYLCLVSFSLFSLCLSWTYCHVFHFTSHVLGFFLFPIEGEGLLFLSFVLLFPLLSSSLASLAMPSFLQPTRTNLMGDKSVWLTVIKKDAGKLRWCHVGLATLSFTAF